MLRNDNYKTGNLLDVLYHQKCYKLFGIDLPKKKKKKVLLNKLILQEY